MLPFVSWVKFHMKHTEDNVTYNIKNNSIEIKLNQTILLILTTILKVINLMFDQISTLADTFVFHLPLFRFCEEKFLITPTHKKHICSAIALGSCFLCPGIP